VKYLTYQIPNLSDTPEKAVAMVPVVATLEIPGQAVMSYRSHQLKIGWEEGGGGNRWGPSILHLAPPPPSSPPPPLLGSIAGRAGLAWGRGTPPPAPHLGMDRRPGN
jgi:hypothetical protein